MQTFIMVTCVDSTSLRSPHTFEGREKEVMGHVRKQYPNVEWLASYATFGPYDFVDLFRAPDMETALMISTLFRTFGHARTEVWPATDWNRFKELSASLPTAERR